MPGLTSIGESANQIERVATASEHGEGLGVRGADVEAFQSAAAHPAAPEVRAGTPALEERHSLPMPEAGRTTENRPIAPPADRASVNEAASETHPEPTLSDAEKNKRIEPFERHLKAKPEDFMVGFEKRPALQQKISAIVQGRVESDPHIQLQKQELENAVGRMKSAKTPEDLDKAAEGALKIAKDLDDARKKLETAATSHVTGTETLRQNKFTRRNTVAATSLAAAGLTVAAVGGGVTIHKNLEKSS
jgi:hypothetical protein